MSSVTSQFLRFCLVGGVGFLIDAGLTMWLHEIMHRTALESRVVAFLIAATGTWALNRRFTFASSVGASSWVRYVLLTSTGALINIGVYMGWLRLSGERPATVLAGVALGSIAAMGFNFTVSRKFVFSGS